MGRWRRLRASTGAFRLCSAVLALLRALGHLPAVALLRGLDVVRLRAGLLRLHGLDVDPAGDDGRAGRGAAGDEGVDAVARLGDEPAEPAEGDARACVEREGELGAR